MIKNLLTYRIGFSLKALFCLGLFLALGTTNVMAQFAITEDFRGVGNPDIIIGGPGGTGGTAYLTSGVNDPLNAGWLRLTNSTTNQKGYAYVNKSFPSTLGVLVDFEYKMWRSTTDSYNGADGIGVFLFNAASTFQLGGYGGSLGYAPNTNTTATGLAGGYVGVGLDAYGNYANPIEGKPGGPGVRPNAVVLRGPTTGNTATTNRYLAGKTITTTNGTTFNYLDIDANPGTDTDNALDYNSNTINRPTDATFYRRVQIELTRLDAAGIYYNVEVRWKTTPTGPFVYVTDYTTTDIPPALLKIGFAASTGGGINYHEIRNLLVTTPGNLRVVKRADKDILRTNNDANGTITYTIEVTNDTDFEIPAIAFTDRITDSYGNLLPEGATGFDVTNISSTGFVSAALPTASSLATNEITGTLVLAANSVGYVTITGILKVLPDGSILQNTVSVLPGLDDDLNNNTSVVRTPVTAEDVDLILLKSVADQCINTSTPPKFTVQIANTGINGISYSRIGNGGTRVSFYNVVPPGYTYNDSSTPGGFAGIATIPTDNQNNNVTARWSKVTFNNTPSAGYTTYYYVARGTDPAGAPQVLGAGMTYPHPVTYTMVPPVGTNSYTDTSIAKLFTDYNYNTPIETAVNQVNNDANILMYVKPGAPTVSSATLYYCIDEDAPLLTATKSSTTNTLRWYLTSGGFSSEFAIKPNTNFAGSNTYYVSQVNGDCEGPTAAITVVVGSTNTGLITAPAATCPNSPVSISGDAITGATYRWQSSADGATWTIISGATLKDYTSGNLSQTTYFRRLVTLTIAPGKTCETPGNWVKVTIPNAGVISGSQNVCDDDVNNYNPSAFSSVQAGDVGTVDGITYTYRWQISNNGTTGWSDISGATGATYDSGNINATRYYRRLVKYTVGTTNCEVPSNVIVVYFGDEESWWNWYAGTIGAAQSICYNTTPATLTSTGFGGAGLGNGYYEWEYSTTGNSPWIVISDASLTSGSYSPGALTQDRWYRRKKLNGCNDPAITGSIKITVLNPTVGSISLAQPIICYNTATTITSSQSGTTGYGWEYAEGTSGGTWLPVSPAVTSATLTTPALTASRRYRRYTVSGGCQSVPTNIITITVKLQTNAGTITSNQNLCSGSAITPLTGTAASGEGTITYLWEQSVNGTSGWGNAAGTNNGQNYIPGTTTTMSYRRVATVAGCSAQNYSNVVTITFSAVPTAGGPLGSNQTICSGETPTLLGSTTADLGTGTGTITYAWQSSTNGGASWSADISGATGSSYQPGALTQTTLYQRFTIATNGTAICRSSATASIIVNVQGVISAGTMSGNQTICYNTAATITGSAVTPVAGATITYRWESSATSGGTYTNAAGTFNGPNYTSQALTATTYFRRIVISTLNGVACESAAPTPIMISINTTPVNPGAIMTSQTICSGTQPPTITTQTASDAWTYLWQYSTDGVTWTTNTAQISPDYFFNSPPVVLTQTTYFRRFGVKSCPGSTPSNIVTYTVPAIPNPGSIGSDQLNVCRLSLPAMLTSVTPAGAGTTYQWQISTAASGSTWSDIPGATSATYQPGVVETQYYRRLALYGSCSVASNVIRITSTITMNAGGISGDQTLCSNVNPSTILSSDGGNGGGTYRWDSSPNGTTWTSTGVLTQTYPFSAPLAATTYYRRAMVGTSCVGEIYSNTVTKTIVPVPAGGTAGPNQTICNGGTAPTLSVTGNGAGTTYRWDSSTTSASGPWTLGVATTANYSPGTLASTTYYRRATITGSGSCEGISTTVTITVSAAINGGTASANQNICNGGTTANLSVTGTVGSTFRWDSSTTSASGPWGTATGAPNAATYAPGTLTQTTYYRRATISGSCEGYSNTVTITVSIPTLAGAISGTQTICMDTAPTALGSTTPGAGSGTVTYRWEYSVNGSTGWTIIAGQSLPTYQPLVLHSTRYYRRTTISTSTVTGNTVTCESGPTTSVIVTTKNCKVITNPMVRSRVN